MGCFSFSVEIKEDRTLQLPAGSPSGRVTVAITPADDAAPTGHWLLAKLLDLQAAFPLPIALAGSRSIWRSNVCGTAGGEGSGSISIPAC